MEDQFHMLSYWYEKHGHLEGFSNHEEVLEELKEKEPVIHRAYINMKESQLLFERLLEDL